MWKAALRAVMAMWKVAMDSRKPLKEVAEAVVLSDSL